MPSLVLYKGREKSLLRRHPWVFSGSVAAVKGEIKSGDTIGILSADQEFLGWGAYSPHSQIRARIWSWDQQTNINRAFFEKKLAQSALARSSMLRGRDTDALRLVHGESDGLPGLIVDRYGEWIVVQFLTSGVEKWRSEILQSLVSLFKPRGIYERSDVDVRRLEGLEERVGLLWGEAPPDRVVISEQGTQFDVDLRRGQKTGFYLDQRRNRLKVKELAAGTEVLDCFCYSGGFSIAALQGGAMSVTGIDVSGAALAQARSNLRLNGFMEDKYAQIEGDVFRVLRQLRDRDRRFDLIVLDPPKFAPTTAQVERAVRGYKDINLLALKLLRSGGVLTTFSCSSGVGMDLFQKIVAGAALDAEAQVQLVEWLHQDVDHPVALNFPEGEYLSGLVLRKE
ncbi:MAG: 23S rRNA methyltransferase [Anaerolineae bacterium UTCFX2]|nr:class I SAM-dependent rRNA methyltransferase [Anaerolineae bacterium]OQY89298.1 MAG: 23S rRNA methyltransferase [Anaerolineae bacterium UTCFX2]